MDLLNVSHPELSSVTALICFHCFEYLRLQSAVTGKLLPGEAVRCTCPGCGAVGAVLTNRTNLPGLAILRTRRAK